MTVISYRAVGLNREMTQSGPPDQHILGEALTAEQFLSLHSR